MQKNILNLTISTHTHLWVIPKDATMLNHLIEAYAIKASDFSFVSFNEQRRFTKTLLLMSIEEKVQKKSSSLAKLARQIIHHHNL